MKKIQGTQILNTTDVVLGTLKIINTDSDINALYAGTTDPTDTTNRLNYNGDFYATRVYNAVYNDLAEFFEVENVNEFEPGDVLIMSENGVIKSNTNNDKKAIGVYSDTFGYALGASNKENKIPIGLIGRVKVKIKEPCEIGDLLVSSENGFAKVDNNAHFNEVIGKVLQNKNTFDIERIEILIR